jgi:hypothetical protein
VPEDEDQLPRKVAQWLRTKGYPLEMRVANAFRAAGFSIIQSAYFGDPRTGKARELDVLAMKGWRSESIQWQLLLLFECKVSKKKPWVMFSRELRVDDTEGELHYYRVPASRLGKQLILKLRRLNNARAALPLLAFTDRPGYGLQLANIGDDDENQLEDRRDPAFDAATKIAHAAVLHADSVDTAEYDETPVGQIVLPIVIVEGLLFDAHLDAANELVVSSKAGGVLDWSNPVGGRPPTWIRISTEDALPALVADAEVTARYLSEDSATYADEIDRNWKRNRDARDSTART